MSGPDEARGEEIRQRLRDLRVDPPDEGFEASLHRRLVEAGSPAAPGPWARLWMRGGGRRRWAWPAAGLAAGAAAFLVLGVLRGPSAPVPERTGALGAVTTVPSTRIALVHVNLSADVAVASAEIRISLPEGLVFWADGAALAERSFEWQQPLAAGSNEIPIAVRGERPGRYLVRVTTRIGDTVLEHEVPLEVTAG